LEEVIDWAIRTKIKSDTQSSLDAPKLREQLLEERKKN
jgi:hypothetical protein